MADKPKVPSAIETYFKKKDAGDAYMQTHDDEIINAHREGVKALIKARQAVAGPEKKITHADIEVEHLQNADVQNTYVNAVKKHLLSRAKEKYKGFEPKGPGEESGILELYSGFTDKSLREFYNQFVNGIQNENGETVLEGIKSKAHFSSSRFASMYQRSSAAKKLKERIEIDSYSHLHGTEHVKDILKYTGADKHLKDTSLIRSGLELLTLIEGHKQKGEALDDKETYALLNQSKSAAAIDAKYHETAMKKNKKDQVSLNNYSKMYVSKKAA